MKYPRILGGFVALPYLWDSDDAAPLFPSEHSARWFVRAHREDLIAGEAIALHCGRTLIHPQRLGDIAMRISLAAVKPGVEHVAEQGC